LNLIGQKEFALEDNLNLLGEKDVKLMLRSLAWVIGTIAGEQVHNDFGDVGA